MNKKIAKMLDPHTVIIDKEIIEDIKEEAKKESSKKAREINRNALELLRKMRR